tara:strand:+ start:2392 stop:2679 length:288 start_codon:yes stop_codon:yes gene_type:complete
MDEGEVVELLRTSLNNYLGGDLHEASKIMNQVHVEIYESSIQFHDMLPVDAVSCMAIIRVEFPTEITKGTESWNRHYKETMRAISELAEDYLNTL